MKFFLLKQEIYILYHDSDLAVKNPPSHAEDLKDTGLIPESGRSPGGGHGNPLKYSCLENPRDRRSFAGYSSELCKELDMTEATAHTPQSESGLSKSVLCKITILKVLQF